jgi:hypothetical protein
VLSSGVHGHPSPCLEDRIGHQIVAWIPALDLRLRHAPPIPDHSRPPNEADPELIIT